MADHQKCTCPRCSRTITPGDTIVFGAGGPSHWDCQRPRVLSAEERALLFAYCLGHPVGKCIACIGGLQAVRTRLRRSRRSYAPLPSMSSGPYRERPRASLRPARAEGDARDPAGQRRAWSFDVRGPEGEVPVAASRLDHGHRDAARPVAVRAVARTLGGHGRPCEGCSSRV